MFVYACVFTYRVTAPENNLSMILFEDAVRGENEKNKQMDTVVNHYAYNSLTCVSTELVNYILAEWSHNAVNSVMDFTSDSMKVLSRGQTAVVFCTS